MPLLPDLARLRVEIFREFPYLYDGDIEDEQTHLRLYAETPGAAVIVARAAARIVGASTCLPLSAEHEAVKKPFLDAGVDVSRIFYFGESVLEPSYRGQGIGVGFFKAREAQAARLGFTTTAFCAIQRPADHPLRPQDYVPLDEFWRHRGYRVRPNLVCTMAWRDVTEATASPKTLQFWAKTL